MKPPMMSLGCIEFMSRAILIMSVNVVIPPIATNADIPGNKWHREITFRSKEVNSTKVCSTQNPKLVFNRVRSKTECTIICLGTEGCTSVNWKKPSTCELYDTKQSAFVMAPSCTYLDSGNTGKEYKFFVFYQQLSIILGLMLISQSGELDSSL